MTTPRILIYLLRRDLRLFDNPVLHEISRSCQHAQRPFTHLLPLYVFSAQQVEVSGFLSSDAERSPFPEARSPAGGFWRCGPHRAQFLAESVWDLKKAFEAVGSGLEIRVGMVGQVVKDLLDGFKEGEKEAEVVGVWMTDEEGSEEKREERDVRELIEGRGKEFRLWMDEKYFVDECDTLSSQIFATNICYERKLLTHPTGQSRDLPFQRPTDLPDVFTSFRKMVEPLRNAPRRPLPVPQTLPPLPPSVPPQGGPFVIPPSLDSTINALKKPLHKDLGLSDPPRWPSNATTAHPFHGGETTAHERVKHLVQSGNMSTYKDSRNGMLGTDFSTKLSAWLALGSITARQIHDYLLDFEEGRTELGKSAQGYGKGENRGTAALRFELLWRDYMRLCTRKFGRRLFRIEGFRNDSSYPWTRPSANPAAKEALMRFLEGKTGTGLIDASMRELYLTGYTSNRARQNVASFLAKRLGMDWRIGAEWYECMLTDYDLSNNWGNWQYNSGVGNDPRGEARVFNPVKQSFDYDPEGKYIKNWVEELRQLDDPQTIFQAWRVPEAQRESLGLGGLQWVERPLKRIEFHVGRNGGTGGRGNGKGGHANGAGRRGDGGSRGKRRGEGRRGQGKIKNTDEVKAIRMLRID